jgi:ABC-type multidrug transport system ATPase subunit
MISPVAEPIIALRKISFNAQNHAIVKNVSYEFAREKTTALIGPSGGGKSTVLKLAAGLLVPERGEACFFGKPITAMRRAENLEFRRQSAFVFQDSALWANQTIMQILDMPLKIHFPAMQRADRDRRIAEVLEDVGYKKDIKIRPAMLSMGEQKLVAFARALLCDPELLYLDEWTESLDDEAAQRLIGLVERRKEKRNTVIFVSHDMDIIKKLADYIVIIRDGEISSIITGAQLQENAALAMRVERGIAQDEI